MKKLLVTAAVFALVACTKTNTTTNTESTVSETTATTASATDTAAATTSPATDTAVATTTGDTFSMPTNLQSSPTGLQYTIDQPGTGAQPQRGQLVSVHYTGWLTDGSKFDSSRDRGEPITFPVGTGRVIEGWDEALLAMKVGEKRTVVIPPGLAYGADGRPPVIPPNSTLVFKMELVSAQ